MPARDKQLAAVDLGSNSFHMMIARVRSGQLEIIDRIKERVQMAAGFDDANNLEPAAVERGLKCLERFGERLSDLDSVDVRAVGTNTLRKAKNSGAFLEQAEAALGHPIDIISGHEEARIIYLGVANSIADDTGRRLVIDIGGGSTEFIIGERFETRRVQSVHMGCVSHGLRFFGDGKLRREAFREATTAARVEIETFEREFRRTGWVSAVGSSGTVTSIDAILQANGWSDEGITRAGLRQLREALIGCKHISKVNLPGLSPERANVLPAGLAILQGAFKSLKIDKMSVSPGAMREGLLYDTIGRSTHEDVRVRTIETMVDRYGIDRRQASRVESTALRCLDQVAIPWSLHHPNHRWLLLWACRLHEVGLTLSYSGYHKHSAYIVANSDMAGFSRGSQQHLAAVIEGHRRRFKPAVVERLRVGQDESRVRLAILLRIATTLNRSRDPQPLPPFQVVAAGSVLEMRFTPGWIDKHPLTAADLANERDYLRQAGFEFKFE